MKRHFDPPAEVTVHLEDRTVRVERAKILRFQPAMTVPSAVFVYAEGGAIREFRAEEVSHIEVLEGDEETVIGLDDFLR